MTYPNPRVTGAEVPEVAQEFDAEVARHLALLEADRAANQPVTPAEERTGVSDVQHAVAGAVAEIRRGLDLLSPLSPGLVAHLRLQADRIEQWVRGGQR